MNSLVKRLITAALLIPVVIWLVLYSTDITFLSVLSVIVFIGAYEWASLSGIKNRLLKALYSVTCLLIAVASVYLSTESHQLIMYLMLGFWLITVAMLITIPNVLMGVNANVVTLSLLGAVIISSTWLSLYLLRINFTDGNSLLMYLLLLIWIADSGAYFAGRAFGKHKLAPAISPGKSIEGVLGGLIACFIFSYFALEYIGYSSSVVFLAISLTVAFVSVYGDLFESLMKRKAGVKDSGSILPGHGGVLDRLDSLIAAGPFFVACLYLFVHQL